MHRAQAPHQHEHTNKAQTKETQTKDKHTHTHLGSGKGKGHCQEHQQYNKTKFELGHICSMYRFPMARHPVPRAQAEDSEKKRSDLLQFIEETVKANGGACGHFYLRLTI